MLQWEVVFVPPARIKRTAHDGQGHMCEIKSSGYNICLHRVFSAGFALDLQMTTGKHLLKVRLCSPGSQSLLPTLRECSCLKMGPAEPQAACRGHPVCLGAEPPEGPCWGWKSPGRRNACVCWLGWRNLCPSPWGHPRAPTVHSFPADKLTAAWAVYKAARMTGEEVSFHRCVPGSSGLFWVYMSEFTYSFANFMRATFIHSTEYY